MTPSSNNFFCKKVNLSVNNKFLLLEPVSAMCLNDTLLKYKHCKHVDHLLFEYVINLLISSKNKKKNKLIVSGKQYIGIVPTINFSS